MSQTIVSMASAFGASSHWLVDSAIKVAALLIIAGLIAIAMNRGSAARRHSIWLVAIAATLVLPLMSACLPQWRILPAWAAIPDANARIVSDRDSINAQSDESSFFAPNSNRTLGASTEMSMGDSDVGVRVEPLLAPSIESQANRPDFPNASAGSVSLVESVPVMNGGWLAFLPWCWAIGAGVLLLRLAAARFLLGRAQAESMQVNQIHPDARDTKLVRSLHAATSRLRIKKAIIFLVHPDAMIPIVWGIWSKRLLLPEVARQWSEDQLQSVLLHELAHIKRRDAFTQLLAQAACLFHWFNPMVWFAAWRLHVERERACDDMVLKSGVKSSEYAEHLLNVATRLTSSPWTQACGLAMAHRSSLHGRLTAVLDARQNRRSMTSALMAVMIVGCVAIALPVAMMSSVKKAVAIEPSDEIASTPLVVNGSAELSREAGASVETKDATNSPEESLDGLEQYLDWSEPVEGLRGAIIIRSGDHLGKLGKERRIFLVIQNVSVKPIRFCDTEIHETDIPAADVEGQKLYLKDDGEILFGLQNAKSTKTDQILQPDEKITFDLFKHEKGNSRGLKTGDMLAEGIIKDSGQSLAAVLNIVHAPEGAWVGKIRTPATRGLFAAESKMPKSKEGETLFRYCIDHARLNGDIPGGLLSRLHELVEEFIRNNTGDQSGDSYAKKMQPILTRFENQRDWKQTDVVALFDEIAMVTTIPLERTMQIIRENTLQRGQPLPTSLKNANWGDALPGGLRMAWILEPREAQYHLGSSLKSRVVLHNTGNEPVVFVTRSFHQPAHAAFTSGGAGVPAESTERTTIGRPEPYRLHPGESCELHAPGIGIGARDKMLEDWSNIRVGTWILPYEGDEIVFQPGKILLSGDHTEKVDPDWWLKFITERIERDSPLPTDPIEREVVLFRVVSDLFGTSPLTDEATAFLADKSPDAVSNLANLLSIRSWHTSVVGSINSGEIKFRVLPVDPKAATRPRMTMNPGRFNLGEEMRFIVSRRPDGERLVNEANIVWFPKGKESVPTKVPLPNGYDSWAAGWLPETTVLWVIQKGLLDSYDFTDNAAVKVNHYEGANIATARIPAELHEALRESLAKVDVPRENPKTQPPATIRKPQP